MMIQQTIFGSYEVVAKAPASAPDDICGGYVTVFEGTAKECEEYVNAMQ